MLGGQQWIAGYGDCENTMGMAASVLGFLWGWKEVLQDTCGDGKTLYGFSAGM